MVRLVPRRSYFPAMKTQSMRILLLLSVALALCTDLATAGDVSAHATGVQVHIRGLRSHVVPMGPLDNIRLRHPAAARNHDTLRKHDVLRYWCYVPGDGTLSLSISPVELRGHATVERRGSFGGQPMAMIVVDPFVRSADGSLVCADSLRITVSWSMPMVEGRHRVPPTTGPVLNPTWYQVQRASSKGAERALGNVDPSTWYDPTQPHVRIETSRDGIACVLAQDVLAIEPSLRTTPLNQLRLFARAVEQPLHIVDTDGDNVLSDPDSLLFVGSHPRGDTTWLDLVDTTTVYMVTRRTSGIPRRITESDTSLATAPLITNVRVRERIEVDSGYYHPGSGISEDYSTFLTPMSMFEGFYWYALNARARQSASFLLPFTPFRRDSFSIVADVVSSSNVSSISPDHGVDVRVNGGPSVRIEGDGFARYGVESRHAGATAPAVVQSVRVYASGVPGAWEQPAWFSEILVDAIELHGPVEPILSDGRLRGIVQVDSRGSALVVANVERQAAAFAIDTTTWTLRRLRSAEPSLLVRTGASRSNSQWIDDARPTTWSLSIAFNDSAVTWSEQQGIALGIATPTGSTYQLSTSADDIISAIGNAPASAVITLVHAGVQPSQSLIELLQRRGATLQSTDSVWTWVGNADTTVALNIANDACGAVANVPVSWSQRTLARADLPTAGERYIVIGAGAGIERARVRPSNLTNLRAQRDSLAMSDVVVITHPSLREAAQRWADYRAVASKRVIRVVDVTSVFAEYDAGRHSPESMRAFLADVWNARSDRRLTHAMLIGSASWDVRGVLGSGGRSIRPDLVPTYGRPSSDYWFGLLDDPNDVAVPELIVARFPVLTNAEAHVIIDKVIDHDTSSYTTADRTALYVGGGETEDEGLCQIYQDVLSDVFGTGIRYTEVPLCLDTLTVCKSINATPGLDIRRHLASGVGMMNYIGHGGTEVFDIEGWDPQELANSRYPVLATFSCLTGAFSNPTALCRNGQYLIEPSRGVVAAMGATGWQYKLVITQLHIDQHEVLRTTSIRDIGRLMYAMKRGFGEAGQQFSTNAVLQFNLLGDPFTRIRIDTVPEISITPDRVVLTSPSGSQQIREDDRQCNVSVRIWNEGIGSTLPLSVRVRRTFRGITDSSTVVLRDGICRDATIPFVFDVVEKVGLHQFEIELDPDRVYGDRREDNVVRTSLQVFARSLLVLEPGEYQHVAPSDLRVRLIDVVSTPQQPMAPRVYLAKTQDTSSAVLRSSLNEFTRSGSIVDWTPASPLQSNGNDDYWLAAWAVDQAGVSTAITWVPVRISPDAPDGLRHFFVSPSAMLFASDSVELDTASSMLVPARTSTPVYVRSHGTMTNDPDRDPILEVRVGDSVIIRSAFRTGINVLTMKPSERIPSRIRRYDTSPTPAPLSSHNGFARECIAFLRDSVSATERVIVAACDESFTRFVRDSLLDEFQQQLVRLGATRVDALGIASSYALVGSRTAQPGLPLEAWQGALQGSVTIDSLIGIRYAGVQVLSPLVSPLQSWQLVQSDRSGDVGTTVIGVRADQSEYVIDTSGIVSGASIPRDVVGMRFAWTLRQDEPRVGALRIEATPVPQWLIEPDAMSTQPAAVIRGDTTNLVVRVRNARTTESAPEATLRFDIVDASTMIPQVLTALSTPSIGVDETVDLEVPVATAQLPAQALARATLQVQEPVRQRFAVRERCESALDVRRDSLPPGIEAYVNGRRVYQDDQVPTTAAFEIRITDNAKLPIGDPEKVIVFVNGIRIRPSTAVGYAFIGTDSAQILYPGTDVRAVVRFTFPMEAGENLLIVRATDAFQNADTLELSLFPVDDVVVTNARVAPNPTSGITVFRADVIADEQGLVGELHISDAQGRIVRTLTAPVRGSGVELTWDGRTSQNQSCSTGLYVWRFITSNTAGSVLKTVSGTLLILR